MIAAYYVTAVGWVVLAAFAFLALAGPRISQHLARRRAEQ